MKRFLPLLCVVTVYAAHPRDGDKTTAAETMARLRGAAAASSHEARLTLAVDFDAADRAQDGERINRPDRLGCVSLDWWPSTKCDYDVCAWDQRESFLTTDLTSPKLRKAVTGLAPVILRLGGTLTDFARIGREDDTFCVRFSAPVTTNRGGYEFSSGCLTLDRWDELYAFAQDTGASLVMGINALIGRSRGEMCSPDTDCHWDYAIGTAEARRRYRWDLPCCSAFKGEWDPSDAQRLLEHMRSKQQHVYGLEFGNELVGDGGIVAHLDATIYAHDFCRFHKLVQEIFPEFPPKLIAFNSAVDTSWLSSFRTEIRKFPGCSPDVIAWHGYLLGKGLCRGDCNDEPEAGAHAIDPAWLDKQKSMAESMQTAVLEWRRVNKNIQLWVGEAGGAYNSGAPYITDTFHSSFWFLDSLGVVGEKEHGTFCRQSLHGGNYGLLARGSSFAPTPDYFALLLWQKLMGKAVLATSFVNYDAATDENRNYLRVYARRFVDSSNRAAVLLINLSREKSLVVDLDGGQRPIFAQAYYSITGDSLSAKTVYLNGRPLRVAANGELPEMLPAAAEDNKVVLPPLSYSFVLISTMRSSSIAQVRIPEKVPARQTELRMVHAGIRQALSRWDEEATKHGIKYHLEYGALLGWARGEEIIPHDHDADLLIDAASIPILERLALDTSEETSFFVDAGNHHPLPFVERDGGQMPSPPVWVLFRAQTHRLQFSEIDRVDCQGRNRGKNNVDGCSFTGPVGRIIHFGGEFEKQAYVDLFLAGCPFRTDAEAKTWHCRKATNDCSYCPSTEAIPNTLQLPEHGGGLRRCFLSGVKTWCPQSREWTEDHLRRIYGDGWRNEDEKYTYSNTAAVESKRATG